MLRDFKGRGVEGSIDAKGVAIKDGGDKGLGIIDEEFIVLECLGFGGKEIIVVGIKVVGIGVNPAF